MTTAELAGCAIAQAAMLEEDDTPSFLQGFLFGAKQVHNSLIVFRALELIADAAFIAAVEDAFDHVEASFSIDLTNLYIPFGNTNPGLRIPSVNLTAVTTALRKTV